jgi:hypothetical protein
MVFRPSWISRAGRVTNLGPAAFGVHGRVGDRLAVVAEPFFPVVGVPEERGRGLATIRRKMGHFSRDNARSRQIRLRAVLARIPDSSCIMQALLPYSRAV